ncbi:23S rRNA pseudouridine(1911/1915/1917) synthase RluD [Sulfuriflexus sp.]|uniref:23S rRNA pseudouridine(1911/1915/1917) synthase RluD n=1 Tax=Sulfuriflexus sp. TaxID=2015443 RepID=UPI0028CD033A|nr:23S rRNA pseudouridine(1911/1915/1917) synthase RluD [Sulfuriflexus sp.]MDT8404588.1 23S rRNA pseudouridine(1911/1915/1917) synthase RluD [Sulfuriflexus sp.]
MSDPQPLQFEIPPHLAGQRLDQALAELLPDYSRARLQLWIKAGKVQIDGETRRPRDKLRGGEQVAVQAENEAQVTWEAEDIPLDIVYEDESIMVINKPAGMVVHPATGNYTGTLVNALLHHDASLKDVPRAGIIHRLDKDTSGLLVVARTLVAHNSLIKQLQARTVKREYEAVVTGLMTAGGTVKAAMGRHPVHRTRMAVLTRGGKEAVTHYRVLERYRAHTHIRVRLETGRTHQIRVHMAHIRYPLVGDPVYGGRLRLPPQSSEVLTETLRHFNRQALHAAQLGFDHPQNGQPVEWTAPLPADMRNLLAVLAEDLAEHADA